MITAIVPSITRHAAGRASNGPSRRAPRPNPVNQARLAVAAPALHATSFADRDPGTAFPTATMIRFDRKDTLQHRFARTLTRRDVDPPTHFVPGTAAFTEAVRLGLGWGLLPEAVARPDVAAGRLVELAPGRHLDVPLYWQFWRLESAALAALTTAVRDAARTALR